MCNSQPKGRVLESRYPQFIILQHYLSGCTFFLLFALYLLPDVCSLSYLFDCLPLGLRPGTNGTLFFGTYGVTWARKRNGFEWRESVAYV